MFSRDEAHIQVCQSFLIMHCEKKQQYKATFVMQTDFDTKDCFYKKLIHFEFKLICKYL